MSMVTLDEVKQHLRVDGVAEDDLIQTYIGAAEGFIKRYCGQDFEDKLPASVKVACLMIVGGLFETRQHVILSEQRTSSFTVNTLVYDYLEQYRVNRGIV